MDVKFLDGSDCLYPNPNQISDISTPLINNVQFVFVDCVGLAAVNMTSTTPPREVKVGVTAENQYPHLLTVDQVCW